MVDSITVRSESVIIINCTNWRPTVRQNVQRDKYRQTGNSFSNLPPMRTFRKHRRNLRVLLQYYICSPLHTNLIWLTDLLTTKGIISATTISKHDIRLLLNQLYVNEYIELCENENFMAEWRYATCVNELNNMKGY